MGSIEQPTTMRDAPAQGKITDEAVAAAKAMIGMRLRPEGPYLQDVTIDTIRNGVDTQQLFATLDLMTEGRAAWNVVTSMNDGEALNMGKDEHLEHDTRYDRADEFVEMRWPEIVRVAAALLDQETLTAADVRGLVFSRANARSVSPPHDSAANTRSVVTV